MIGLEKIKEKLESNKRYWIAFSGDSITSCEWVHPNWREIVEYVLKDQLNYDWGIKTFNLAYDGSTTRDLVVRVEEIKMFKPDLVIMLTGANDPFHGNIKPEETVGNVTKIKSNLEKEGIKVVVGTDICPGDKWAEGEFWPYAEGLNNSGLDVVKVFEESKKFPRERIFTFISEQDIPDERVKKGEKDFWHPNQLGNAYIAKVILEKVFGIEFDPEKFIEETREGKKLPRY